MKVAPELNHLRVERLQTREQCLCMSQIPDQLPQSAPAILSTTIDVTSCVGGKTYEPSYAHLPLTLLFGTVQAFIDLPYSYRRRRHAGPSRHHHHGRQHSRLHGGDPYRHQRDRWPRSGASHRLVGLVGRSAVRHLLRSDVVFHDGTPLTAEVASGTWTASVIPASPRAAASTR